MNPWTLTWGDKSWTINDLTVNHVTLITLLRGKDEWDFSPTVSPMRLFYVLCAFIAVDEDRHVMAVLDELRALPFSTVFAALATE